MFALRQSLINTKLVSKKLGSQLFMSLSSTRTNTFDRTHIPDETLFIIDGTSIVFQAYFSTEKLNKYPDAILTESMKRLLINDYKFKALNNNGDSVSDEIIPCGTLVTMASMFVNLIDNIKPRYLAIAFDAGRQTFRKDMYAEYKQHRPTVSHIRVYKINKQKVLYNLLTYLSYIYVCVYIASTRYGIDVSTSSPHHADLRLSMPTATRYA